MNWRSAYKRAVNVVGIAAGSFLAELATLFICAKFNWDIRTPGMLVGDRPGGSNVSIAEKLLVLIGVDSTAYFLLILGLIALFKWRFGKKSTC
jgi:hypothetical protein